MLVLTRRPGEQIVIDECIVITVVRSRPGSTRIGIETCQPMNVRRAELEPLPNHERTSHDSEPRKDQN